jgi:16S rRNA G1207 methylase RsmC
MNLQGDDFHFHYNDDLKIFDNRQFDYIVSNPPFHFEHENNIEVSLDLFHQSARILKNNAHFQIVANKHLNYLTHLEKYFTQVDITAENEKYIIYECWKIEQEEDPSEDQNFNV